MTVRRPQARLQDALDRERGRLFVGRARERAELGAMLRGKAGAPRVLYIHGPGGSGKTTLAHALARDARAAGWPVLWVDADVEGRDPDALADRCLGARSPRRQLLIIDEADGLRPMEGWVREVLLPALPAAWRVVMAGRQPPSPRWADDPGWRKQLQVHALEGLSHAEAAEYLARRGVDGKPAARLVQIAAGEPLTLSLLADRVLAGEAPPRAADAALAEVLVRRYLRTQPSARQRLALAACARATALTLPLLRVALSEEGEDAAQADALLDWLATLPFVHRGQHGLRLHARVRPAVRADAAALDPLLWDRLGRTLRSELLRQLELAAAEHRGALLHGYLATLAENPLVGRLLPEDAATGAALEPARADDLPAVWALVRQRLGAHAERRLRSWQRVGGGLHVLRAQTGEVEAAALLLRLPRHRPRLEPPDPVVAQARRWVSAHATERGAPWWMLRAWTARDDATEAVRLLPVLFLQMIHRVVADRPAALVSSNVHPERWRAAEGAVPGVVDLEGLDVVCDGHRWGLFGTHFGEVSPLLWLRGMSGEAPAATAASPEQVREALDALQRAGRLAETELGRLHGAARVSAALHAALSQLEQSGRDGELARVLRVTYVQPAVKQSAAAGDLGLPLGTYRHRLRRAIDRLSSLLPAHLAAS